MGRSVTLRSLLLLRGRLVVLIRGRSLVVLVGRGRRVLRLSRGLAPTTLRLLWSSGLGEGGRRARHRRGRIPAAVVGDRHVGLIDQRGLNGIDSRVRLRPAFVEVDGSKSLGRSGIDTVTRALRTDALLQGGKKINSVDLDVSNATGSDGEGSH